MKQSLSNILSKLSSRESSSTASIVDRRSLIAKRACRVDSSRNGLQIRLSTRAYSRTWGTVCESRLPRSYVDKLWSSLRLKSARRRVPADWANGNRTDWTSIEADDAIDSRGLRFQRRGLFALIVSARFIICLVDTMWILSSRSQHSPGILSKICSFFFFYCSKWLYRFTLRIVQFSLKLANEKEYFPIIVWQIFQRSLLLVNNI